MRRWDDAHDAIRDACSHNGQPMCVGWDGAYWITYDPVDGAPKGVKPEIWCPKAGRMPIPLSEEGETILVQLLQRVLQ